MSPDIIEQTIRYIENRQYDHAKFILQAQLDRPSSVHYKWAGLTAEEWQEISDETGLIIRKKLIQAIDKKLREKK